MEKGLRFIKTHLNNETFVRDLYEVHREFWDCDKVDKAYLALEPYFSNKKEQYEVAQSIKRALKMLDFEVHITPRIRCSEEELHRLYHTYKNKCCVCGTSLNSAEGVPLGSVFVLDVYGNFYCTECDYEFEDGDERIYDEE